MCEIPGRTQPREGNIPAEAEEAGEEEEGTEEERKKKKEVEEEVRENERERNFQKACRHRAKRNEKFGLEAFANNQRWEEETRGDII